MSLEEEFRTLFSNAEKLLRQQKEIFGDYLPLNESVQKENTNLTNPLMTKSGQTKGIDLFGNFDPPTENIDNTDAVKSSVYPTEPWVNAQSIEELNSLINTCKKCALSTTRNKFVFGVGNPKAEVVVVGEAPGADEDEQGEPFVGRGGQLLTKILEAIRFKREEVYICNILKCRPPNNRDPQSDEINCCEPYLWKQLELIKPKMILCVGRIAGQALLKTSASLSVLREKIHDYRDIPLMVTYHPAALLRNPNWKRPCWEDVQKFRKLFDDIKERQ